MAFQKVDNFNEVWKHEKEDDMIQGVLIQRRADIGKYKKTVYYGIAFGIIASILAAFIFTFFSGGFEGIGDSYNRNSSKTC